MVIERPSEFDQKPTEPPNHGLTGSLTAPAAWQLPPGVSRGTWDYATTRSIASDYDAFHDSHPLLDLDQKIVAKYLFEFQSLAVKKVIDLGCGTGRSLLPLAKQGWTAIGIDLSQEMLQVLQEKSKQQSVAIETLHRNMVELEDIEPQSAQSILCLYSSLGMVRGRSNRRRTLKHVARILTPGGLFLVHVHNRGAWLRMPGGIRDTCKGWLQSMRHQGWELGDRIYPYRGLPSMFLHIFSRQELKQDLRAAGLTLESMIALNERSSDVLPWPQMFPHLRAGGFIAVARSSQFK